MLDQNADQAYAATPIHRVTAGTGPMFLVSALDEINPAGEVGTLQTALTAHEVPSVLKLVQGRAHAKGYQGLVWNETLEFLEQYVSGA